MSLIFAEKKTEYDSSQKDPITHTLTPYTTGASVVALKFNNGIILATDQLYSYGSMHKFKNIQRVEKINNDVLFASTGELSDFQVLTRKLKDLDNQSYLFNDGVTHSPKDLANYLARQQYHMRNKFDPYYSFNVVAGIDQLKNTSYLSQIDIYGNLIEEDYIATGFANYLCLPVISESWNPQVTEEQAREILKQCFKLLFYRHARTTDKIQISIIDKNGARIEEPFVLDTKWDHRAYLEKNSESKIRC